RGGVSSLFEFFSALSSHGESYETLKVDRLTSFNRQTLYSVLKASSASGVSARDSVFEFIGRSHWAYSSVGLEHTPDKREVGSSNLPRPTNQVVGDRR